MVNNIWSIFIIIGISYGILSGNSISIGNTILNSSSECLKIFLQLFPVIALWLGIMKIAEDSGLMNKLSRLISKILHPIFPEVPKNHIVFSFISSNIVANALGLGSAATPFGLKAMEELQKLNSNKEVASKSMLTFTALNTSAITIIPTTLLALRSTSTSIYNSKIILIIIISTSISTIVSLLVNKLLSRRL